MARRPREQADAPGQDSFLDVVTNLVGVIIILVMVIGTQAKDAIIKADAALAATPAGVELPSESDNAKAAAERVEADVNLLAHKIEIEKLAAAARREERTQIDLMIAAAEKSLAERRAKLDDEKRADYDRRTELLTAQSELEDLIRRRSAAENSAPSVGVIDHLPTPMVKTVFGQEAHFRLLNGRLTRLPWDELVARLKAEAPGKVEKLRDSASVTESIGPVQGFRMKYTLKKVDHVLETKIGPARQTGIELDQFILSPVADDLGEPLADALRPNSEFRDLLKSFDPNRTTITVWVYPDSFHQFRELKQDLFKLGFLTASRPMPEGTPIGGSPSGTKSMAQ